jgi:hypothetical protein
VSNNTDCDDAEAAVHPSASEVCNGIDDDCDSLVDDDDDSCTGQSTWYRDADGDGYGDASDTLTACEQPTGYVADDTDCDDAEAAVNPGASEVCNGIDDDCDGLVDDDDASCTGQSAWYRDADGDGYGNASNTTQACTQPAGYVSNNTDCDDAEAAVNPSASEVCNGIDDDCDGLVDDDDASCTGQSAWYRDADGDGYGDATDTLIACEQPTGYVADDTDCDDAHAAVHPGASEVCNGIDDDCNGLVDDDDDCRANQTTWYVWMPVVAATVTTQTPKAVNDLAMCRTMPTATPLTMIRVTPIKPPGIWMPIVAPWEQFLIY